MAEGLNPTEVYNLGVHLPLKQGLRLYRYLEAMFLCPVLEFIFH